MDTRWPESATKKMWEVQTELADKNVFKAGTLAFYDTFAGMIPCKVKCVREQCYGFRCGPYDAVQFEITESRGGYTKGEVISADARHVPPRKMIKKREYSNTILTGYSYVVSSDWVKTKTPA